MVKIGLIRSLVSNHQSNNFPKQLNKHLNVVTFLREYFYEFCKVQHVRDILKGPFSELNQALCEKYCQTPSFRRQMLHEAIL